MDESVRGARVGPVDRRVRHRCQRDIEVTRQAKNEQATGKRHDFPFRQDTSCSYHQRNANQDRSDADQKIEVVQDVKRLVVYIEPVQKAPALRPSAGDEQQTVRQTKLTNQSLVSQQNQHFEAKGRRKERLTVAEGQSVDKRRGVKIATSIRPGH